MGQLLGVLFFFGLIVLSVWSVARPPWAFALVNLMFPLKQVLQGYFPVLVLYGPHLSAAIAAIAATAVMYKATRKQLNASTVFTPVYWATLALYVVVSFGLLYTPSFDSAWGMYRDAIPYLVVFLFVYPFLLNSLDELRQGLFLTVLIGSVITVFHLMNPSAVWSGGRFLVNLGMTFGVSDFTSNPLALADVGGFMMICAALMSFKDKGRLGVVFTVAGLVLGLGLAIISGSRGQIIFAVIVSVAMYPIARDVRDARQFFAVAGGALFMMLTIFITFSLFLDEESARRWQGGLFAEAGEDRSYRVLKVAETYFSNPGIWIQGMGTNSFPFVNNTPFDYPHNLVAELLLDYGMIGISLLVVAMLFTYRAARDMIRTFGNDEVLRGTVAAMAGLCIFAFMVALKQGSVIGQPTPFYFWFLLAKIWRDEQALAQRREYLADLQGESVPEWGPQGLEGASESIEDSYNRDLPAQAFDPNASRV